MHITYLFFSVQFDRISKIFQVSLLFQQIKIQYNAFLFRFYIPFQVLAILWSFQFCLWNRDLKNVARLKQNLCAFQSALRILLFQWLFWLDQTQLCCQHQILCLLLWIKASQKCLYHFIKFFCLSRLWNLSWSAPTFLLSPSAHHILD
jgi:hypothetical protein